MPEMISVEQARELVLSNVKTLGAECVPVLKAAGRVCAADVKSDIDIAPFAHSAMDGFAVRASQIEGASKSGPVNLKVIANVAAGSTFDGEIAQSECVRIMTGAPLPKAADSVVKYEIVKTVNGNGSVGSTVQFTSPANKGSNVRQAGEEARAGEVILQPGCVINPAGVGFLAGCGQVKIPVYKQPHVAIISIGSELVDPSTLPTPGKIRNSNSYALAASAASAHAVPEILPIVEDNLDALKNAVLKATETFDFVVTSGGASNGDFDFIKPCIDSLGSLLMTSVNMRPGKAQTFGIVNDTPVFGLAGNPAAAYVGFEMLIRPALRKMQGYTNFERPRVVAKLTSAVNKRDPRRMYLRSTLTKNEDGSFLVTPAKNQSSGLFSTLARSNCLAILPEGKGDVSAGSSVECMMLDVSEDVCI